MIKNDLKKVLLIGVGNEYRNDDVVGLMVARAIQKKQIPSVTIKEVSGDGTALMEAWQGFEKVVIVDAVSSGAKLGKIFKIDASKEIVPAKFFHYSTHAFSVAEGIELARAMKLLPSRLLVYGIEAANFSAGINISNKVEEAVVCVIEQIHKEIEIQIQ